MKCLSIRQPWADYIIPHDDIIRWYDKTKHFIGQLPKNIENRTWHTEYKGTLLIHAGKMPDFSIIEKKDTRDHVYGAIIGKVDMIGCAWETKSPWHEKGLWGFCFVNRIRFKTPIPYKGKLGLFEVPDNVILERV